jgi:hypothetical protein
MYNIEVGGQFTNVVMGYAIVCGVIRGDIIIIAAVTMLALLSYGIAYTRGNCEHPKTSCLPESMQPR